MSDYAAAQEAIRVARGAWTQQVGVAGTQGAVIVMNAGDTAISVAVSSGNTSVSVKLPSSPVNGDRATVLWQGNPSRMASVTDAAAGYTVQQGPVSAGTMWKFRYSGARWQAVGP